MKSLVQQILRGLVLVHPGPFRREFGEEMLLDYEELNSGMAADLLLDAVRSVVRQWVRVLLPGAPRWRNVQASPRFLTNQPASAFTSTITPNDIAGGFLLSILLFSTFWYAEDPMRSMLVTEVRSSMTRWVTSQESASPPSPPLRIIITDVSILNLENGAVSHHRDLEIHDGVIVAIGQHRHRGTEAGVELIDGHGKFLMPGMWDMHTHIKHPEVDFPVYLANGVLGIRSMGGEQDKVFAWDAKLKDGSLFGPLAFVSGPILDGPGGPVEPKSYGVFIATPEEGREEVDTLKAKGADFVKVYDALSRESYFAIAAESKSVGLPLTGHVPRNITILEAVHAGQRSIEHGIEHRGESTAEEELLAREKTDDYFNEAMRTKNFTLIPEGITRASAIWREHFSQQRADNLYRALTKNGTYLCPTLVTERTLTYADDIAAKPDARQRFIDPRTMPYWQPSMNMMMKYATPAYKEWLKTKYRMAMQQLPKEQADGVQLLAGTDLTVPFIYPGSSVHDEVRLFAEAGLTPLQALQTATTRPVAFFGLQKSLGSVTVGKKAELVLMDGNPLEDLENLDRIDAVLTHKRALLRPELDRMEVDAATAAQRYK